MNAAESKDQKQKQTVLIAINSFGHLFQAPDGERYYGTSEQSEEEKAAVRAYREKHGA